jgi:hypothetical protein
MPAFLHNKITKAIEQQNPTQTSMELFDEEKGISMRENAGECAEKRLPSKKTGSRGHKQK